MSGPMKIYLDEVRRGNELADKHIGTLMLLAYEGCISDSRARELIGMDIHKWRSECKRIMEKYIDEEPTKTKGGKMSDIKQQHIDEAVNLLASAYQIARRKGDATNWEAFEKSLLKCLAEFNRNGASPRTYRLGTYHE